MTNLWFERSAGLCYTILIPLYHTKKVEQLFNNLLIIYTPSVTINYYKSFILVMAEKADLRKEVEK